MFSIDRGGLQTLNHELCKKAHARRWMQKDLKMMLWLMVEGVFCSERFERSGFYLISFCVKVLNLFYCGMLLSFIKYFNRLFSVFLFFVSLNSDMQFQSKFDLIWSVHSIVTCSFCCYISLFFINHSVIYISVHFSSVRLHVFINTFF